MLLRALLLALSFLVPVSACDRGSIDSGRGPEGGEGEEGEGEGQEDGGEGQEREGDGREGEGQDGEGEGEGREGEGEGAEGEGDGELPVQDPAPEVMQLGEHTCPGCPGVSLTSPYTECSGIWAEIEGGELGLTGTAYRNEGDGILYIRSWQGPARRLVLPVTNSPGSGGTFSQSVPLGPEAALVKVVFANASGKYVRSLVAGAPGLRLMLQLGDRDPYSQIRLHVIRPGGRLNELPGDCFGGAQGNPGNPDWGVPGELLDDCVAHECGSADPAVAAFLWHPQPGIYRVLVEYWPGEREDQPVKYRSVEVTGTSGGGSSRLPESGLLPRQVWKAATIDWPSGAVTPSQEVIDCSAAWGDHGCMLDL